MSDKEWLENLSNQLDLPHERTLGGRGFRFERGVRYLWSSYSIPERGLYRVYWGINRTREHQGVISREHIAFILEQWLCLEMDDQSLHTHPKYERLSRESITRMLGP